MTASGLTIDLHRADCLEWLRAQPDRSVDLVITSPPYEDRRKYGELEFSLSGEAWVAWAVERYLECVRVCRGVVAWVVQGKTARYRWSAVPYLLGADLHRRGVNLRRDIVYHRVGVSGSGGPDWLRLDHEHIICATPPGRLFWSHPVAMGHPPKWAPGGAMSNRMTNGQRRNQWGHSGRGSMERRPDGSKGKAGRPSHQFTKVDAMRDGQIAGKLHTKRDAASDDVRVQAYTPPVLANPGDVITCVVGGGLIGSKLAHQNEAPFPERLAEFFIRSFCPPGGTVLDPFVGSGTVPSVALCLGRSAIGIDARQTQIGLATRRIAEAVRLPKCSICRLPQHAQSGWDRKQNAHVECERSRRHLRDVDQLELEASRWQST